MKNGKKISAYASPQKKFDAKRFHTTDGEAQTLYNNVACSQTFFSSLTSIHKKDNSGQLAATNQIDHYHIYIYSPLFNRLTEIKNCHIKKIDFSKHTKDSIIIGLCSESKRLFDDRFFLNKMNSFFYQFLLAHKKIPKHLDYNQMIKRTLIEKCEKKRKRIYSHDGIIQTLMKYIEQFKKIKSHEKRTLTGFKNWLGSISSKAQRTLFEYIEAFDVKQNINTFHDLDKTLGRLTYGGPGSFFTANMSTIPYQLPSHNKSSCVIL